jgi:hypothetical protein
MPNKDLDISDVVISNDRVKEYLGKDKISGNHLTTEISRLEDSIKETPNEEKQFVLNYLKGLVGRERNKIDAPKRARMNTDGQGTKRSIDGTLSNNFKERKKENGVDMSSNKELKTPDLGGKNQNKKLTYYESYDKEIDSMRYLIEYMDNNKDKI